MTLLKKIQMEQNHI